VTKSQPARVCRWVKVDEPLRQRYTYNVFARLVQIRRIYRINYSEIIQFYELPCGITHQNHCANCPKSLFAKYYC